MVWKIWILVPVLYGIFCLWYFNWRAPLSADEIERYMHAFNASDDSRNTDAAVFRKFLEDDDGKEVVMANLVELHKGDVSHPVTGEKMSARQLVGEYFGPFARSLLLRAGHPVYQARTVGGYIDSWNADSNVSFGVSAMMRYRSRRDMVELVIDPRFSDSHIYKLAAIERTISFPTQVMMSTSLRPPHVVLLVLLLLASVAQNVTYFLRP